jgi:hypothetical protein
MQRAIKRDVGCGGPVSDAGTVSRAATLSAPKPAEPNGYTRPSSGRIIYQRHLVVQVMSGTRNRSSTASGRTLIRVKPWSGSASAEPVLQSSRWCRRPPIGTLRRLGILGRAAIFFPSRAIGCLRFAVCQVWTVRESGCAPRLPCLLHLIALIEGSCKHVRFPYHMPRLGLGGRRI